jgi:hypothetical protein
MFETEEAKAKAGNDSQSELLKHYVSAVDLDRADYSRTFLVENLLEAGRLYEFFGKWKSGKSLVAADMAAHLSIGRPWLGRRVVTSLVVYIAGEAVDDITGRFAAWRLRNGVTGAQPVYVRTHPASLADGEDADWIASEVEALSSRHPGLPVLLIVDTLARNLGPGVAEDGEGMSAFGNNLQDRIVKRLGCTCIVVHHTGHMEQSRSRGGSQWHAVLDGSFRVEKTEAGLVTLESCFARSSAAEDSFAFRIEVQELPGSDNFGNAIAYPVLAAEGRYQKPAPVRLGTRETEVLEVMKRLLESTPKVTRKEIFDAWREAGYGPPASKTNAVYSALETLKNKKFIQLSKSGWVSFPGCSDAPEF